MRCASCGREVEASRRDYAVPTCETCLPPPRPLPIAWGKSERMFPVLYAYTERRHLSLGWPREVPWRLLAPHERQAMRNHGGQTLERLASRGGLGLSEMAAILEDRPWRPMSEQAAAEHVLAAIEALCGRLAP